VLVACQIGPLPCVHSALSFNGVDVPAESVQAAYLAALNGLFAKIVSTNEAAAGL
jgi:hypothetical protein